MSHQSAARIVYNDVPYLVVDEDRGEPAVFGPFDPGTEPSLDACLPDRRVTDRELAQRVIELRPISPAIPAHASSLAERE